MNTTERFGTGVLATAVITPLSAGIASLAQITGYLKPLDSIENLYESLRNMGISHSEAKLIANSRCPVGEVADYLNRALPGLNLTAETIKTNQIALIGIAAPIFEEILFRGIVQDLLLDKLVRRTIKAYAPDTEMLLDTTAAKAARIGLTALLFSAFHLQNYGTFSDEYVKLQVFAAFFIGLGFGMLKESKAGLTGAIAAHMCNNMIALTPILMSC